MGIQLRKPLFCLFQYLPERNIWFIHCLPKGKPGRGWFSNALPHGCSAQQVSHIAFPLGGRWADEAGSDEGAILYPTGQENLQGFRHTSVQRGFFYCSVGYRVAPSSVTCGDSFPPRGSQDGWYFGAFYLLFSGYKPK